MVNPRAMRIIKKIKQNKELPDQPKIKIEVDEEIEKNLRIQLPSEHAKHKESSENIIQKTNNGGFIILGRSDSTLNPGGIRMGTAELYRVVESIKDVIECIAAEQKYKNDNRVVLFVKLNNNKILNIKLINTIKNQIKILLSPKHIPAIILQVSDIPKTKNGKIVEITIKKIINNEEVTNLNSLANPGCLKDYKNRKELKTDI